MIIKTAYSSWKHTNSPSCFPQADPFTPRIPPTANRGAKRTTENIPYAAPVISSSVASLLTLPESSFTDSYSVNANICADDAHLQYTRHFLGVYHIFSMPIITILKLCVLHRLVLHSSLSIKHKWIFFSTFECQWCIRCLWLNVFLSRFSCVCVFFLTSRYIIIWQENLVFNLPQKNIEMLLPFQGWHYQSTFHQGFAPFCRSREANSLVFCCLGTEETLKTAQKSFHHEKACGRLQ